MRPKGESEAEYLELIKGLERMARLYKNTGEYSIRQPLVTAAKLLMDFHFITFFRRLHDFRHKKSIATEPLESSSMAANAQTASPTCMGSYFSETRIAVYSALFGSYDKVWDPIIQPDNIDYYMVTDADALPESRWQTLDPRDSLPDGGANMTPTEKNRWCKMHPHLLFPSYDYSVYVDANILVVSDFTPFLGCLRDFPIAMHRHYARDCAYDEVDYCIRSKKDDEKLLRMHRARLAENGLPPHAGLLEAPVIARRHHDPLCVSLMDQWWDEFHELSNRDQISLADVLWVNGIDIASVGTLGPSFVTNDKIVKMPHLVPAQGGQDGKSGKGRL